MKLDQLDGLVAFITVAQKRSFTAAAAQLEVTPPAVSQAVRTLEQRLGVRLLNRTTRSVGLTEAGARFLARVGPAVSELADATGELDDYRGRPAGRLRLTLPRIAHRMLIRPWLAEFLAAFPELQLELSVDDSMVDIVEQGFDAGIRLGESIAQDMVALPLGGEMQMVVVASPAYLARHGVPASLEALREHDCVRYRFRSSGAIYRWELLREGRLVEVEVDGSLIVSDSEGLVEGALDGIGLSYLFEGLVAQELVDGRLVRVLPEASPRFAGFHLYYPSRHQLAPKLRCFIDFWRARLGNC
ncbi:LysR family transcriptional regulator [Chitinimonas sp.]|uniref:LysR family transcriptional regulator n=1 Tax=Chitinimonas sp. TaxID=1934313 RepID=UPI002F93D624